MIFAMFIGGGIFVLITLIGGLISGKEAMGLGDVKLMGALGLFLGIHAILASTLAAFFIGAAISIIVLLVRKFITKSDDEYIPFGPFLSLGAVICIFVGSEYIFNLFMGVCQALSNVITGWF